jgi:DNA-binding transcriptional MerR regulator
MATGEKAPDAFRTIGELSAELGVAQHILRYWETKFPQLRPLQRAGNRRYYRPADVALARRIHRLLNEEGYTVKGVQKLLRTKGETREEPLVLTPVNIVPQPAYGLDTPIPDEQGRIDIERLKALRHRLAAALDS